MKWPWQRTKVLYPAAEPCPNCARTLGLTWQYDRQEWWCPGCGKHWKAKR